MQNYIINILKKYLPLCHLLTIKQDKLFPKLQLGNPVQEALASCLFGSDWYPHAWKQLLGLIWSLSTFYRDDSLGKLELPRLVSQAGAWETAEVLIRKYCFARSDPRFGKSSTPTKPCRLGRQPRLND